MEDSCSRDWSGVDLSVMASASVVAMAWRPLPLLRTARSHVAVKSDRLVTISTSTPRPSQRYCSSTSCSGSSSLSSVILRNSLCPSILDVRLRFSNSFPERKKMGKTTTTRAGMRLDPGGGKNDGDGGIVRVIVNLAFASGFTYLAVTGKLGWVFDTLVSLWLLAVLIPIISFVAFLWFAEREIVKGACPNCGQAFQVFEFAVKEQPNLCPYCSQPFKLDSERQFVRDEPRFSNEKSGGFRDAFGSFGKGSSSPKNEDAGGIIVDVEAEVVDRD